jgi:hypothetical protein
MKAKETMNRDFVAYSDMMEGDSVNRKTKHILLRISCTSLLKSRDVLIPKFLTILMDGTHNELLTVLLQLQHIKLLGEYINIVTR